MLTPLPSLPPRRIKKLLESSGKVALGGRTIAKDLFIEPTVLTDVKPDDPVMLEEIFGPLLPIVTVQSAAEAITFINSRWVRWRQGLRKGRQESCVGRGCTEAARESVIRTVELVSGVGRGA